jgi:hypothetical protein
MAWHLSGRWMEACSCKLWCPCWLGPAEPDQGWCSGAIVLEIERGESDGLDLSGLRAVFVGDWPADFFSGNGTARWFIDERADAGQRRALEAICTGQQGGPWAAANAVVARWLPAQPARIELTAADTTSVRVGEVGQFQVAPVRDEAGRPTEVRGAAAMGAFQLERMELARGDGTRFSPPEMRAWQGGGEGTMSTFAWSA